MGIAEKHAYRFGFLKSERWQTIRAEKLVKFDSACYLCGTQNFFNDVHHVSYPSSLWYGEHVQCVVICRTCHDAIHQILRITGLKKPRHQWKIIEMLRAEQVAPKPLADVVIQSPLPFGILRPKPVREAKPKPKPSGCLGCGNSQVSKVNVFPSLPEKQQFFFRLCQECGDEVRARNKDLQVSKDQEAFKAFFRILKEIRQKNPLTDFSI